ncbi:MAG: Bax inhibitor-1/YccA family protein [Planctomycetes bacterium]|nr:Bax inhibitor-1/YccA family protein [Planctomycetota bacterium]
MRTANPALKADVFTIGAFQEAPMTVNGTVNKSAVLLALVLAGAAYNWHLFNTGGAYGPVMIFGLIGGFITAIVTVFKKQWAMVTGPLYAALEGLFLGGISAVFDSRYPGIVLQAVGLTFGVLACLLFAYRSGLIKATENFKLGVVAATGGIAMFYLFSIVLGFFNVSVPLIHSSGTFGIAFSVFVVVIAALNLVLDFDFIEQGAAMGSPKYMEWYAAFGLMVTLVWLYLEILRLLAKLNSRR